MTSIIKHCLLIAGKFISNWCLLRKIKSNYFFWVKCDTTTFEMTKKIRAALKKFQKCSKNVFETFLRNCSRKLFLSFRKLYRMLPFFLTIYHDAVSYRRLLYHFIRYVRLPYLNIRKILCTILSSSLSIWNCF